MRYVTSHIFFFQAASSRVSVCTFLGPDSRRWAQKCAGVTYLIYVTPPQVFQASALFTKHLPVKLRRRSVNHPAELRFGG